MKSVHLVCNAHLDPVWIWEWEEGAAEALSTFRTAADFCDEFPGFVFNHNEALLYQWIEEYEPALFRRIQRLVRRGQWHIMGGWFVQPDCNMPSGESFVRQILIGRRYFKRKFGRSPTTAINFDPFGHTRGLVQILRKSGYDSYLHCRPDQTTCPLPADTYTWQGYDGSRITGTRAWRFYCTARGTAHQKVRDFLASHPDGACGLILWGVGDHGGGPSRLDLQRLEQLIRETPDARIRHSTPEAYFRELARRGDTPPLHAKDVNLWAPGCYTSQIRIKQRHRLLENELYATEKLATSAWLQRRMAYPATELATASRDLALCQFHDILPGSSFQPAEEAALRILDHGLETVARAKARAFFALAQGQPRAKTGEIPILVANPHPFRVRALVECEFNLADQNWKDSFTQIDVARANRLLPAQVEREASNIALDWRKRVVFLADLAPSQINRFDCRTRLIPARPAPALKPRNGRVRLATSDLDVIINTRTGLLDRYRVGGVDFLRPGAALPLVIRDIEDPWGMSVTSFPHVAGRFRLLSKREGSRFSGLHAGLIPSVRVIEDGPVRAVVEAVFGYRDSFLCLRYKLPKRGAEIELELRVFWNEKDRMLKLALPTPDRAARPCAQVAFGSDDLRSDGTENVAQKWFALRMAGRRALTCINDGTYAFDCRDGVLRLTLLRSPAYSAHPIGKRPTTPQDRFSPRIDQGERLFRFWLNAGPVRQRLDAVDREALAKNEKPMALSFFPSGSGRPAKPLLTLSDPVVQVAAVKKAEDGNALIVRLFEPTGRPRSTTLSLPVARMTKRVSLAPFEIRTLRIDPHRRTCTDVNLIEEPLR